MYTNGCDDEHDHTITANISNDLPGRVVLLVLP